MISAREIRQETGLYITFVKKAFKKRREEREDLLVAVKWGGGKGGKAHHL